MKYFRYNSEIETKIKSIKKTILLSMNGISSDNMKNAGLIYKQNFGLIIPRIKEIAAAYPPDATLAEALWTLKIRETMILATLLYPPQSYTYEIAKKWMAEIPTSELCEQLSLNLLKKVDFAPAAIENWIASTSGYTQICGYLVASRVANKLSTEMKENILHQIEKSPIIENFSLYHAQSVCLRYFCRQSKNFALHIQSKISIFEHSPYKFQQYIFEEVTQEIKFYYND